MTTRLQKLLDLAGKATPGGWKVYHAKNNGMKILGIGIASGPDQGSGVVAYNGTMWLDEREAYNNAHFIEAADPVAIKQLAELVEAMRGALLDDEWDRMNAKRDEALRLYDAVNQEDAC